MFKGSGSWLVGAMALAVACSNPSASNQRGHDTSASISIQGNDLKRIRWDEVNAPERMGLVPDSYEIVLQALPETGELSHLPWGDSFWPNRQGGLSHRWNLQGTDKERIFYDLIPFDRLHDYDLATLSPAEKYDIYLGNKNWDFVASERKRTRILTNEKILFWTGICHGWAPASMLYDDPSPVTLKGPSGIAVPFGAADIKALLTSNMANNRSLTFMASRRCNVDEKALQAQVKAGLVSAEEYFNIMNSADCEGINAGAFHIILTNMIGVRDQGFIVDIARDIEVWNQPVTAFKTAVQNTRTEGLSAQAAEGTVKEVLMETIMTYRVASVPHWEPTTGRYPTKSKTYQYWLELDANDAIIGGNWVTFDRPDFLWNREKPKFDGIFKPLAKIYQAATKSGVDESVDPRVEPRVAPRVEVPMRVPALTAVAPAGQRHFEKVTFRLQKQPFGHSKVAILGIAPSRAVKVFVSAYDKRGKLTHSHAVLLTADRSVKYERSFNRHKTAVISLSAYASDGKRIAEHKETMAF